MPCPLSEPTEFQRTIHYPLSAMHHYICRDHSEPSANCIPTDNHCAALHLSRRQPTFCCSALLRCTETTEFQLTILTALFSVCGDAPVLKLVGQYPVVSEAAVPAGDEAMDRGDGRPKNVKTVEARYPRQSRPPSSMVMKRDHRTLRRWKVVLRVLIWNKDDRVSEGGIRETGGTPKVVDGWFGACAVWVCWIATGRRRLVFTCYIEKEPLALFIPCEPADGTR
jgi:hypothetical protein